MPENGSHPAPAAHYASHSACKPLKLPVFRMMWSHWLAADISLWMSDIAAAWMMRPPSCQSGARVVPRPMLLSAGAKRHCHERLAHRRPAGGRCASGRRVDNQRRNCLRFHAQRGSVGTSGWSSVRRFCMSARNAHSPVPAARMPGIVRSRSPRRGGVRGRPDSRYGCAR